MQFLKRYGLTLLLLAAGGYAYWVTHPVPCAQPVTYHIGTFATSFGISQADFLDALNQAAQIWEKPTGLHLFQHDKNGDLPVNLIYDQRQAATDKNKVLVSDIDQNKSVADSVKAQYDSLKVQYLAAKQSYDTELGAYNTELSTYNSDVAYWNERGGAPQDIYQQLEQEKATLQSKEAALNDEIKTINSLGAEFNALIDKYNLIAEHINQNVSVVNQTAGREFNEGEYIEDSSGKRINIYEFSDKQKLVRVLAHELGHALGLEHNDDPQAIMYYLNAGNKEKLTAADIAELKTLCGIK